ncbi:reticulon-like protein B17 isoform X2 [Coffea arabica]|uniref:Reticulon-like protein n=1 Tax=Coffea arabica TaxID=13443 RepID=A0ABM4UIM0_COFAR
MPYSKNPSKFPKSLPRNPKSMDPTPPYHRSDPKSRTKSASRLSKLRYYNEQNEVTTPNLSLEIVPSSPTMASPSPSKSPYGLPLHELLLLSPSPLRRSKTRLADRLEMADDAAAAEGNGARKRFKNRNASLGLLAHASPRNNRRSRRRLEQDMREEKDFGGGEDMVVKPRKKRHSETNDEYECNLDGVRQVISDLIMWKDVAKSSLWFGFGSLCFVSSCFTSGINVSIFSVMSQLGLLFLGLSFFTNSVRQRDGIGNNREFKLKDEDILRVGRLILPAANLAISKTRELFSGEPAMTLKVVPFLLLGAEYGHLLTLRRLCALGFFISFTCPKLYSSYSVQICRKVDYLQSWMLERWRACSHKKIVAASAVTAFWNLTSIRIRIFAAFICLVIVRYSRQHQHLEAKVEEEVEAAKEPEQEEELQRAMIVVENEPMK